MFSEYFCDSDNEESFSAQEEGNVSECDSDGTQIKIAGKRTPMIQELYKLI
jgi:hypothetical protein